jgi:hypothetical protein
MLIQSIFALDEKADLFYLFIFAVYGLYTFSIGNKVFTIEKITKEMFDKIPETPFPDTSEKNLLQKSKQFVTRNDSILLLKIGKNMLTFKNKDGEAEDYENYKYQGFFPDLNQHVVLGSFVESFNYLLIDASDADTNYACGIPIVSPDKSYFICGNVDLIAAFVLNGFDLYEIKNKRIKLVARKEIAGWGPEKIKWLDPSTILVQRTILDTAVSTMTRTDYVKLLMK